MTGIRQSTSGRHGHRARRARGRVLRLVGAGLGAALVVGAAPGGAAPAAPMSVGVNVRLAPPGDTAIARAREIPGLAVNPADPRHIVEVEEDFLNGQCLFRATFDGGRTWSGGALRAPAGFPERPCVQFDFGGYAHSNGSVAWGAGQNVYTTFSSARPGESDSILVARSSDGGRTFAPAVVAIAGGPTDRPVAVGRPRLAVAPNPRGDKVFLVATGCDVVAVQGGGACNRTAFAASVDAGKTWRTTRSIAPPIDGITRAQSQPVVAADGTVYVALRRGVAVSLPRNLFLAASKDDGATWAYEEIGTLTLPDHLQLATDRRGGLYLAMTTTQFGGDLDVALLRRPAGAAVWSAPVRVNDDAVGNGLIQRLPGLSVSRTGQVELLWHDRRHPYPGQTMEDYYYASSSDGGATFGPNRRVTDRTRNLGVGLTGGVTGGFYWPALVSLGDGRSLAAWGDSREGNFHTNTEDVYFAPLAPAARGPLSRQDLPGGAPPERSVALSRLAHPGGVETNAGKPMTRVVIAHQDDVGSLLAGAVLGRAWLGPVLVTDGGGLTAAVQREVRRLDPTGVFVVGQRAGGAGVLRDLRRAGVPDEKVTSLAGRDAADTARLVARALDTRTDDQRSDGVPAAAAAVVVNPASPDAAAAGAFAASLRLPVLLTGRDAVPAATTAALKELDIPATVVVGGPAAVSARVLAALPDPERLGGRDAAATSLAVAQESRARGLPVNISYVADAATPASGALLAGVVARRGGLLLLAPHADAGLVEQTLSTLRLRPMTDRLIVLRPTR